MDPNIPIMVLHTYLSTMSNNATLWMQPNTLIVCNSIKECSKQHIIGFERDYVHHNIS